ncbi:hypothetical protein SDC9_91850 [bioreactor metagenome]|uniref:Uncharacterized protein n=1 Tax=bioreactor metagenome TaxID=1076179 RepID=A0A645A5Y3_9ZZZZ
MRVGEELPRPGEDPLLGAAQPVVQVGFGAAVGDPVADPEGPLRSRAGVDALSVADDLGPHERLHPVHPGGPQFERASEAFLGPGPPADPVAGLVDLHPDAAGLQLPGGDEPGEAGSDDGDCAHCCSSFLTVVGVAGPTPGAS